MGKATEFSGVGAEDDDFGYSPVMFQAAQMFAKVDVVQRDAAWPEDRIKITHTNGVVLLDVKTARQYVDAINGAADWIEANS